MPNVQRRAVRPVPRLPANARTAPTPYTCSPQAPLATDHELPNRTSATDSAATPLHVVCINPPVPHPIEASSQVAEEFGAVGCRDSC